jgi:hypothetical protein
MKRNDLLFLLGSAAFLVVVWIGFSLIHTNLTSTISDTLVQQIIPIKPTFDTKTIDALKKRTQVTPVYSITNPDLTVTPTPQPNIVLPVASTSATQQGGTP